MAEGTVGPGLEAGSILNQSRIIIEPPRMTERTPRGEKGVRDLAALSKIPGLLKHFQKNPEMVAMLTAAGLGIMSALGQLGPEWGTVALTMGGAAIGASRGETTGGKVIGAVGGAMAGLNASEIIDQTVNTANNQALKVGLGFIDEAMVAPIVAGAVLKKSANSQTVQKMKERLRISQIKNFLKRVK